MVRPSYQEVCGSFEWRNVLRALGWEGRTDINIAETIIDRNARTHGVALYWYGAGGEQEVITFRELALLTGRFASHLASIGVGKGDRVVGVLPRVPETLIAMLGCFKAGAVYVPVFTAFGPDAIRFRVSDSGAKAIVTHHSVRDRLPDLRDEEVSVITVAGVRGRGIRRGDISFWQGLDDAAEDFESVLCRRDEAAVILYTSGSTGQPKGVRLANNFVAAMWPYMEFGLALRPDDMFWPTGDPGWGYGLVCYMVAMAMGVPVMCVEAPPTRELVLKQLQERRVTTFATVPTVLRGVMALGEKAVSDRDLALRCVGSCGEPLNAEVVDYFRKVWRVTPLDHYGSSEFGMPVGNYQALEFAVKPGSMGRPMPGYVMAIVDDDGNELPPETVGHIGQKRTAEGYYSLGYWNDATRPDGEFRGDWLVAGDLGRKDSDGYFVFEGRSDDVINSAGYRIGPFEVESAILRHPAVAEAAVVGKPDERRGEIVTAHVVLRPDHRETPSLRQEIVDVVKATLGKHQFPREITFVEDLPKTESGKIQRFRLRQVS